MKFDPISRQMHRRPLMLFCICFTIGVILGYQNVLHWKIWLLALLAALAGGVLCRKGVFLFPASLLLGALLTTCALIRPNVIGQNDIILQGTIISEPHITEKNTRILLDDATANGDALPTRVMLYVYSYDEQEILPPLEFGMSISVQCDTYIPSSATNPHGFDYSAYLWRQGSALAASASVSDLSILSPAPFSPKGWAIDCRNHLKSIIQELYGERCAPLITALLLGDRSMLPDELRDQFRIAGLAHLLAISGLHISCLAAALDWLLRYLCPRKIVFILVTLFLSFYAFMVGYPVSILRALIMYVLSHSARLFEHPSDSPTNLAVALMLLLLINPLWIADPSLILSFGSVAGLVLLTKPLTPKALVRVKGIFHSPIRWITLALTGSLAAQIATLPALAQLFGELPVYSLFANLPALPLMTASLPFAMLSVLVGCISIPLGALIASPVGWVFLRLLNFIDWVSSLPHALLLIPVWSISMIVLYVMLCALGSSVSCAPNKLKKLSLSLLPLVALCACLRPLTYPTEGLEVLFLDAGQADAAVIRAEDQYYLMDTGEDSTVADHLLRSGIRPSGVFISHPHSDHAGGLEYVLACCPPAVIYVPCLWDNVPADEGVPEFIHQAIDKGWMVQPLKTGDSLILSDSVTAYVHQPWDNMTDDANDASLVISISLDASCVLFTGDLSMESEYAFLPDRDVLKVAHHGSKHSTSPLLLNMTTPTVAVISVGHNSYGHPNEQTLNRLTASRCTVYRTDQDGAVSVLLSGDGSIRVTPFLKTSPSEVFP